MNDINGDFGFLVFILLGCRETFQRMTSSWGRQRILFKRYLRQVEDLRYGIKT